MIMKNIFKAMLSAAFVILLIPSCSKEKSLELKGQRFELKEGDLLFQDLDCGPVCDAIEAVTQGSDGAKLSHVGIVSRIKDGKIYITEAFSNGVEEVKYDEFMSRSSDKKGNPKVLVGRIDLNGELMARDMKRLASLIGHKYDNAFDISDDKYYCSELVYEVFRDEKNKPIFDLKAMTFKDAKTGKTMEAWVKYFKDIKTNVPEGGMGINPGLISRSSHVDIVHAYGCPEGWSRCKY
jgi:hypothetical protein